MPILFQVAEELFARVSAGAPQSSTHESPRDLTILPVDNGALSATSCLAASRGLLTKRQPLLVPRPPRYLYGCDSLGCAVPSFFAQGTAPVDSRRRCMERRRQPRYGAAGPVYPPPRLQALA